MFEIGGTRERPFIVSAFVSGSTLSKALACRQFDPREAATVVRLVADALQYAHERGVIHRDVKPSNIMLDDRGKPYLMDFGLARRDGVAVITHDGAILGTPAYMSPEQAEGKHVDARTDVYSLGVVLYELLTGQRPFQGTVQSVLQQVINAQPPSPIVANRAVPRDLEKICLKCMQKLPVDRYESARELNDDLSRFLEGLPVRARPISPVARSWRWSRRHPKTAVLIGVAAILAISLPVLQTVANRRLDQERENAFRSDEANRIRLQKLFVSKGNESVEAGNPMPALTWFAAALEQLSEGDAHAGSAHRVRLITTMAGPRLARVWFAGGPINSVAPCPKRQLLAIASTAKAAMVLDLSVRNDPGLLLRHPQPLWQCAFSPDGKWLATSSNDANVRIWRTDGLAGDPLVFQSEGLPTSMDIDPTGRLLATATRGGAVRLWDVSGMTKHGPILGHRKTVNQLKFSPDGSLLGTAGSDGAVRLWSVSRSNEVWALPHEGPVNCVDFALDGRELFSGSDDGTVRGWEAKSGARTFELRLGSPVLHLALSGDGNLMAVGCANGRVHVRNLKTKSEVPVDLRHQRAVRALSFSRTGEMLVTGGNDRTVRVWDFTNSESVGPPLSCAGEVNWVALTEDRQRVMAAGTDGILREWTLGKPFKAEERCTDFGAPSLVQLCPDGRWLLMASRGSAQLCNLSGPKLMVMPLADSSGGHAAFRPDGDRLVFARENGDLHLWDVSEPPKEIKVISGSGPLNDVVFSPDGQSIATANSDGTARVFSVAGGDCRLSLPHGDGLKRALYGSDGQKIYTAGGERLCLWDARSGNLLSECHASNDNPTIKPQVDDIRLTPGGRFLLAIWRSIPATVYDASSGELLRSCKTVSSTAFFSDDGTRFVALGTKSDAGTWELSTGKQISAPVSQRGNVLCCAIRGDGTLIATGSADKTAAVWDAETGEAVSPPLKHTDRVIFVGFREGGNQLVTVSADAVIRLWTLDDGTPTERLIHLAKATSGQKIENGSVVALKPKEIQAEWEAAQAASSPDSQ